MGSTTHFSFDILLVLLFVFVIYLSWQKGFYKTLRFFIALLIIVAGLQFGATVIFDYFRSISHLNTFQSFSVVFLGNPGFTADKYLILTMLTYVIFFLIVWSIVYICMLPFRKNKEKELIHTPKKWSIITSIVLGIINGIILLNLFAFSMLYAVPIQSNHPITNLFVNEIGTLSNLQAINQLQIEIEPVYEKLYLAEETLTARAYENSIQKLLEIKELAYAIDVEFENEIIPLLENPLSIALLNDYIPNANFEVTGYTYALTEMSNRKTIYNIILEQEKNNTHFDTIATHLEWLIKHQLLIRLLFTLEDDLQEVSKENIRQTIQTVNSSIKTNKHKNADISMYDAITKPLYVFTTLQDAIAQLFELDSAQLNIEELADKLQDPTAIQLAASNFASSIIVTIEDKELEKIKNSLQVFFSLVDKHIEAFTSVDYLYPSLGLIRHEYKILESLHERVYASTLINSWINDAFENAQNFSTFSFQYLFLYGWLDVENRTTAVSKTDMDGILSKLQTEIDIHSYFLLDSLKNAFDDFIHHRQGLKHLLETGILLPDVVQSFTLNQWTFVSEEARIYIQEVLQ